MLARVFALSGPILIIPTTSTNGYVGHIMIRLN